MPKFIKLTEVGKTSKKPNATLLVNVDFIHSIKQSDSGPDTHLNMRDNHYFFIKESVAEIEAML